MNVPNICVAVNSKTAKNKEVVLGYFKCKDTGEQLATNNLELAFSPFTGGDMVRASKRTLSVLTSNIKADLACIGQCDVCRASQYTLIATAKKLANIKNAKMYCTVCQAPYKVKAAEELSVAIDEHNHDVGGDDGELPVTMEEHEGETLIHASDDADDDEDDDDSADEDDDNADEDGEEADDDDDNADEGDDEDLDFADDDDDDSDSENEGEEEEDSGFPNDDSDDDNNDDEADDDDADLGEFEEPNDDEAVSDDDDDNEDDSVTQVEASDADNLRVNILEATNGLMEKNLLLVPVNADYALVLANDIPVIKLEASLAGSNKGLFTNPNALAAAFNEVVANSTDTLDLSKLGGKPLEFDIVVSSEVKRRIDKGVNAVTASVKSKEASVVDDFRQCLSIASLMVQRNLDKNIQNPLFAAFTEQLKKHGVRGDAILSAANAVFADAGEEYIKVILAKADDLKGKSPTVRNEIAKVIEDSPYQSVTASVSEEIANKLGQNNVVALKTPSFNSNPEVMKVEASLTGPSQVDRFRSLLSR